MKNLLKRIRFLILTKSLVLVPLIFVYWRLVIDDPQLQLIRTTQTLALTALLFLYLSLLPGPLYFAFPRLPGRALYIKARRALGVSAFVFGSTHGLTALFGQLGGLAGLPYLPTSFLSSVLFGSAAHSILLLLTLTSTNWAVNRLGRWWKPLHRLVYLAGVLVLIHALRVGTHFSDMSGLIPQIVQGAVTFYLLLQLKNLDTYLSAQTSWLSRYLVLALGSIILIGLLIVSLINPALLGLSMHVGH